MSPFTKRDQVFHVDRVLDSGAVQSILAATEALPAYVGIVVDLSDAEAVEDFAIASLAAGLGARQRFRLHGLSVHHQRLLRYLGLPARVDPDRVPVAARRAG